MDKVREFGEGNGESNRCIKNEKVWLRRAWSAMEDGAKKSRDGYMV